VHNLKGVKYRCEDWISSGDVSVKTFFEGIVLSIL
jgi:hypothetical protein